MTLWALADETKQRSTRLDLQSVNDPSCEEVLGRLGRCGMAVAAWDITSDVGVPAYLCMFADRSEVVLGHVQNYRGYGCHSTHRIALLRALTEAVQMRLTIISGSRDDLDPGHYRGRSLPLNSHQNLDWLDGPGPWRRFGNAPECDAETFDEEIGWQLKRLQAAGVESVIVVDLTKPDIGLPIVRVIIPGLELAFMDWKYFALGTRARSVREIA
jgi:ribosomal protein S12 methylthiotransferase accessory factor